MDLVEVVTEAFADSGWDIATDTPFAGTYVPLSHLGRTREVTSVMVEVRRDLYQEEPGGQVHDGYGHVVACLAELFLSLAQAGGQSS